VAFTKNPTNAEISNIVQEVKNTAEGFLGISNNPIICYIFYYSTPHDTEQNGALKKEFEKYKYLKNNFFIPNHLPFHQSNKYLFINGGDPTFTIEIKS
jgi:hypothetical protein